MTAVAGSVFTAAQYNQSVRDNLNETAPAKVTTAGQIIVATGANSIAARTLQAAVVDTSETTTSSSYTTLATPGPTVTVTSADQAIVALFSLCGSSSAGNFASMGYTVSGASTSAASINRSIAGDSQQAGGVMLHTGLTPGSNTFTSVYRAAAGTATFQYRKILVIPL
jgi:hypothetical protein